MYVRFPSVTYTFPVSSSLRKLSRRPSGHGVPFSGTSEAESKRNFLGHSTELSRSPGEIDSVFSGELPAGKIDTI